MVCSANPVEAEDPVVDCMVRLGDPRLRGEAARALAEATSARSVFLFVLDRDTGGLVAAPAVQQPEVEGSSWVALLERCRADGRHTGDVSYPPHSTHIREVIACSHSGACLVFVGKPASIETIERLLPLLATSLRAEHAVTTLTSELAVSRVRVRKAAGLARSLERARGELQEQAGALEEARRRAEAATRMKDEFLAMLGHELRNPLAPIVTATEVLRLQGDESREVQIIERQSRQLMRLVDDLMDVARMSRGIVELHVERMEVADVVAQAVRDASNLLEQRRQKLTVAVPSYGLPVDVDMDRMAQVVANLLTNASRYSALETEVAVSARRSGDHVLVQVRDEGFGIAPEMLDTIFERFVQESQSLDRSSGGLGLGLAIVKNLVELHGGEVRASSSGLGKGSQFTIRLPLGLHPRKITDKWSPAIAPTPAAFESRRVLLVDDNEDAVELLGEALSRMGHSVRVAFDGPSALAMASGFLPEIAVLDIGLPVMDGYELARRLRKIHGEKLQLIALTGYGQPDDHTLSKAAGFHTHLVKPVEIEEVVRAMTEFPA